MITTKEIRELWKKFLDQGQKTNQELLNLIENFKSPLWYKTYEEFEKQYPVVGEDPIEQIKAQVGMERDIAQKLLSRSKDLTNKQLCRLLKTGINLDLGEETGEKLLERRKLTNEELRCIIESAIPSLRERAIQRLLKQNPTKKDLGVILVWIDVDSPSIQKFHKKFWEERK